MPLRNVPDCTKNGCIQLLSFTLYFNFYIPPISHRCQESLWTNFFFFFVAYSHSTEGLKMGPKAWKLYWNVTKTWKIRPICSVVNLAYFNCTTWSHCFSFMTSSSQLAVSTCNKGMSWWHCILPRKQGCFSEHRRTRKTNLSTDILLCLSTPIMKLIMDCKPNWKEENSLFLIFSLPMLVSSLAWFW